MYYTQPVQVPNFCLIFFVKLIFNVVFSIVISFLNCFLGPDEGIVKIPKYIGYIPKK